MSTGLQGIILDTARRLFGHFVTTETLEGATKGVWAKELWSKLQENGFTAIDTDGLTYADGLALLQVAGYYAVPVPLAESILASKFMSDLSMEVPEGVVTLGLTPDGDCTIVEQGESLSISGRWREVPWARVADAVLLCAPVVEGKTLMVLVEKGDIGMELHNGLASEPLDVVYLDHVTPRAYAFMDDAPQELLMHAAMTRIMQGAGALERVLDMTIRYAAERTQFGRPIAKFQAVQHQIAEMAAETAAFRAIANKALKAVETAAEAAGGDVKLIHPVGRDRNDGGRSLDAMRKACVLAKIRLAQAAQVAPTHAHQVHGAMGFTEEYPLHHYTRRLWNYRHEYGNERYWGQVLLSVLHDDDPWEFITN